MRPTFFFAALFTLFCLTSLNAQPWQFAKRYSAPPGSILTNAAVSTAPDGSTYIVGTIQGTVMFDNISASTPAGVTQSYLLKMNPSSQAVWVQTFDQKAYHVTTDAQGNVFVAGAVAAGSPASDSLTYLAKYNASGQLLASFLSTGTGKSWARVVRADAAGNCYVTGWKSGVVTFGTITPPNFGSSRDNFLVKLSPDLAQVSWAVNSGSSNNLDEVYDLELDDSGGVYTSGNYSQTFNIFCLCYNGSFFTEKRSTTNGALVWQKIYSGGSGTTTQQVVSLSSDGQTLYTAASFKNTVQIPPNITLTAQNGTDDYHLFASSLNAANGNVQWAKKISFTGDSYITGMAWADDELHSHGYFKSNTLIGSFLLEPQGANDVFYAQVTPSNGNVPNAEKFTGTGSDQGFGIASGNGVLAVSGNTSSSTLTIGNFNLPGNPSSIYVAGKLFDAPLSISLTSVTNASCPDTADGSATVSAQGGTPPYAYLWSNGQTGATATGLAAGTYTVTATDNAGAQISTTATITEPPAMTVGFTSSVNGLTATFSNTSANATTYAWNFGDGQTSTQANPAHTYTNCGAYTVTLTATNLCGTNTSTASVTIGNGNPAANFTSSVNGLTATFSNTSANATTYAWNFGDGQTSTQANPAHTYANCGTYTVTLTATNLCGTNTSTATVTIGNGGPAANFTSSVNGLTATFSNTSANATTYAWNFGDGQTSTQTSPAHTYANCGTYTVTLTAANLCGTNTSTATVTVGNGNPAANFTSTVNGLTATFSNTSANATTYAWNFGDGQTSTQANPAHTYTNCGAYTVTLTATNLCGTNTSTASVTIGNGNPAANFTSSVNGLTATFSNTSANATTYAWNFGDGQTSTQANPAHTYANCGTYTVTLTATNLCGTNTSTATVTIGNGGPAANFTSSVNGLTATFSNTSANAASYSWNFGDGQTSTQTSPAHTYANCGTYTVTLTAANLCGTNTSTATVTVGNGNPAANFTSTVNNLTATFSNASTNAISYLWNFGDGQTSTQTSPAHTYANCGTYTVTLTAANLCGTNTSTATVTVGNGNPAANFTSSVNGLTATFSNSSTNAISYLWNFGDGQTSAQTSPAHTYTTAGTYTVTLTVGNDCGTDTFSQTVTIPPFGEAPTADFTADKFVVCAGDTVHFTNLSVNAASVSWWFPGGEPMNSTENNPRVVYTNAGKHSVILTVYNAFGNDQEIKMEYITVIGLPVANFGVDTAGLTVAFSDSSHHADAYLWEFGDGITADVAEPEHTYASAGTYLVRLTIQNACGANVLEKYVSVGITATDTPEWLDAFRLFPNPATDAFTVEMSGEAADEVEFSLFAPNGQEVHREMVSFHSGTLTQDFETDDLPAGLYLLRVRAGRQAKFAKVVVQR